MDKKGIENIGNKKKVRKGAIPFSLIAVIILILSAFAIVYIGAMQDHWWQANNNNSSLSFTGMVNTESTFITSLATQAAIQSLSDLANSSSLFTINRLTYENFLSSLSTNFGMGQNGVAGQGATVGQYVVTIRGYPGSVSLNTSAVPFEYTGVNSLGMATSMTTPTYIRVTGTVPVTILNPTTGQKMDTTISIDQVVPTTIAFLMTSANRVNFDFTEQGMGMAIAHAILQSEMMANPGVAPSESEVMNALEFAVYLDEAALYRTSSDSALNNYLNSLSTAARSHINPVEIYKAVNGATNPSLQKLVPYDQYFLNLEYFNVPFVFNGQQVNLQTTTRSYNVATSFLLSNFNVRVDKNVYSAPYTNPASYYASSGGLGNGVITGGGSRGGGGSSGSTGAAPTEGAYVYDINFYNFSFNIKVNELNQLNGASYGSNYNIKGLTRVWASSANAVSGALNSQITQYPSIHNPSIFTTLFAGILDPYETVHITIHNSTGIAQNLFNNQTYLSVSVNNMEEGIFSASQPITLYNLGQGSNLIAVTIKYPNGAMEEGKGYVNVTADGFTNLYINTTEGINTETLWTLDMSYLQNVPRDMWLSKLSQFYATLLGYPFPPGMVGFSFNNNTNYTQMNNTLSSYVTWATGFEQYINKNALSTSFELDFQSYSMTQGIYASVATWSQIAQGMITILHKEGQSGVPIVLNDLNFTFENVPVYYPNTESVDIGLAYMEGFAGPGGLITSVSGTLNVLPQYTYMFQQMSDWINNHTTQMENLYGSSLSPMAFTINWIMNYENDSITSIGYSMAHNVTTWKNIIAQIIPVLNNIGIPDSVIGMDAFALDLYAGGQSIPVQTFLLKVLPGNVAFYYTQTENIVSTLNELGVSNLAAFAAVLIGKFAFAANMSWAQYITTLSAYATPIKGIIGDLNNIGVNSIVGLAAVALYKFMFAQNVSWLTYLNEANGLLGTISQIKTELGQLGITNIWVAAAAVIIGKFVLAPNSGWSEYLTGLNGMLKNVLTLENDFKTLGISNVWGFGILILAKFTLASDISWFNFTQNVTTFWMPGIMKLNAQFEHWGINRIVGFAAVLLGKFVLMPDASWAGYFSWITNQGLNDINSMMNSLSSLGVPDTWGLAAVVLGKFIFGANETWTQYLNSATSVLSNLAAIKGELENLGINGLVGLGALVIAKFVFDANESWTQYLSNLNNNILGPLSTLESDFRQVGINEYIGFAALVVAKYLFARNDSWTSYLGLIKQYQTDIEQGISLYKMLSAKYGTGAVLLGAAAIVGGLYLAREYFYPNESIGSFASMVMKSATYWFTQVQSFIGIFKNYGNLPEIYQLMFKARDVVNLVNNIAMYFMKNSGNGVFSILPTSWWSDIHNFIQTYLSNVIQVINIVQDGLSAYTATLNLIESWKSFTNWTNPTQVLTLIKNTLDVMIQDAKFLEEIANFLNLKVLSGELSDAVQVMEKVAADVAQIADVVASVATVIEMFQQQLAIDHGNVGEALYQLFLGFNLNSAMWYFALSGAFGAISTLLTSTMFTALFGSSATLSAIASVLATLSTVLLWVGVAVLVIWIILDPQQFIDMLFGDCSDPSPSIGSSAIVNLQQEISSVLQKTLYIDAGINGQPPAAMFESSAQAAAEMFTMSNVATFTLSPTVAYQYNHTSMWQQDYSYTLFSYAVYAQSTKWSVMNFWESALDLESRNSAITSEFFGKVSYGFQDYVTVHSSGLISSCTKTYTHQYAGNIYLIANSTNSTNYVAKSLANSKDYLTASGSAASFFTPIPSDPFLKENTNDVANFLNNMNMSIAKNISVNFIINTGPNGAGNVIATKNHGLTTWAKELNVAGNDLSHWNSMLVRAKARLSYVQNFGNSSNYTEGMGMLPVYIAPQLTSVQLTVKSTTGAGFYYLHNYSKGYNGYASNGVVTMTAQNVQQLPFYIYLTPGQYVVSWNSPEPASAILTVPNVKTVTLYPFSSSNFFNSTSTVSIGVDVNINYTFSVDDMITPYVTPSYIPYTTYGYKQSDKISVMYYDPYTKANITLINYTGVFNTTGAHFNYTALVNGKYVTVINATSLPGNVTIPADAYQIPYSYQQKPVQPPMIYISYEINMSGNYSTGFYNSYFKYVAFGNMSIDTYKDINPYNPPSAMHYTLFVNYYSGDNSGGLYGTVPPWLVKWQYTPNSPYAWTQY